MLNCSCTPYWGACVGEMWLAVVRLTMGKFGFLSLILGRVRRNHVDCRSRAIWFFARSGKKGRPNENVFINTK